VRDLTFLARDARGSGLPGWARSTPGRLWPCLLCAGCASIGALQPAQTLGKNGFQIGLELHEQAIVAPGRFTAYGMAGVSARYGLFDTLDVGIRFGPAAFEAQVKWQLTPREEGRVIVSVAPLAGLDFVDNGGVSLRFYNFALPVLIGIPLPRGHQLILAPRVHDYAYYVGAGNLGGLINNFGVGLAAGVGFHLKRWWLIPELGVLQPVLVTASRMDGPSGAQWRAPSTTLQVNFSVIWGS
jgi:hypothetical protein